VTHYASSTSPWPDLLIRLTSRRPAGWTPAGLRQGHPLHARTPEGFAMRSRPLVVVATGSSATIVLPDYLVELKHELDLPITVLMTRTAERFVRPEVVGWFTDEVLTSDAVGLNPVELALTAKTLVVLPASGNTLAAAALGLMATPATTALAAAPGPSLYFPQMNKVIWDRPVMRQHVAALRARGDVVVEPELQEAFEIWRGELGLTLVMPAPDEVAAKVRAFLTESAQVAKAKTEETGAVQQGSVFPEAVAPSGGLDDLAQTLDEATSGIRPTRSTHR
jgi:phosphopantothenoylcysteine decarboxylase